jgi:hypothetical protein
METGRWLLGDLMEGGYRRDVDTVCDHTDPGETLLDRNGRSACSAVALKICLKLGHGVLGWSSREYHQFMGCVFYMSVPRSDLLPDSHHRREGNLGRVLE